MATPKKSPAATKKKAAATPNASAPATPGNPAVQGIPSGAAEHNVSARSAAQVADQVSTQPASATSVSGDQEKLPPLGETGGDGESLDSLIPHSVVVTSRREGFRRAGRAWSKTPTTVPFDDLSEDDLNALVADPVLDVVFVAADEKAA